MVLVVVVVVVHFPFCDSKKQLRSSFSEVPLTLFFFFIYNLLNIYFRHTGSFYFLSFVILTCVVRFVPTHPILVKISVPTPSTKCFNVNQCLYNHKGNQKSFCTILQCLAKKVRRTALFLGHSEQKGPQRYSTARSEALHCGGKGRKRRRRRLWRTFSRRS